MRLISSPLALDLVLALGQTDGARLTDLAQAAGTSLSSAQAAMRLLLADGLVERDSEPRPRYRLSQTHSARDPVVELAQRAVPPRRVLDVVLRANPSIEFVARDSAGYIAVEAPLADPRELARLERTLERIPRHGRPPLLRYAHHDAVGTLGDGSAEAQRVRRAHIVKGTLARSFPRSRRRGERVRLLPRVSRRALAAVARTHGLRRIQLFGSAARQKLGSASDVDVLVETPAGRQLSLLDLIRIEADLERLFNRHVDVVTPGGLRSEVRAAIEREGVSLHG